MPLLTVDGREVVESGSFTLSEMASEAVLEIGGRRFIFRYDPDAAKLLDSSNGGREHTYVFGPHAASQVSSESGGYEDGVSPRLNVVFTVRGSAAGPGMKASRHLVTYTATRG